MKVYKNWFRDLLRLSVMDETIGHILFLDLGHFPCQKRPVGLTAVRNLREGVNKLLR